MKINESLFNEYKVLTNRYIAASKHLRELLPRFTQLPQTDKVPNSKTCKELLRELDKIEEEIETTLTRLRSIRHRLLELI
ncbi:MAG: hypothetical protein ABH934_01220 [Chloroflexota bacterium]